MSVAVELLVRTEWSSEEDLRCLRLRSVYFRLRVICVPLLKCKKKTSFLHLSDAEVRSRPDAFIFASRASTGEETEGALHKS